MLVSPFSLTTEMRCAVAAENDMRATAITERIRFVFIGLKGLDALRAV